MPVYEYRCNACQREFEYQQKMTDDDLVKCEVCGEDKLEKLISWSAFRLGGMTDSSWTKQLNGKMTAEQQREVARSLVDKGAPPKRPDKAATTAAVDAAGAGQEAAPPAGVAAAAAAPSETATAAPADPPAAETSSSSSEGGTKE
jgi:putative FmdB family regulatory protein